MFKIDDAIGDIVFISFRNYEELKDFGIDTSAGHYLVRGIDQLGLWLKHPGLIFTHKNKKEEEVDANFLVRWDNINSIMHYPDRDGYDFPSEFTIDVGFKK